MTTTHDSTLVSLFLVENVPGTTDHWRLVEAPGFAHYAQTYQFGDTFGMIDGASCVIGVDNTQMGAVGSSSVARVVANVIRAAKAGANIAIATDGTISATGGTSIDSLTGVATAGYYLRGDGTHAVMSAIVASDVPTLNQSTTGSAATLTSDANYNTSAGIYALGNISTGTSNAAFGKYALAAVTSGSGNVCFGANAGSGITTGSNNFVLGNSPDSIGVGSRNIYVGTSGGNIGESATIRIGTTGAQTKAFLAGIVGSSITGTIYSVVVNSSGQLSTRTATTGTVTTVTATSPLTVVNATTTPNVTIAQAGVSTDGYLSSADWSAFSGKEPAIGYGTSVQFWRGSKIWAALASSEITDALGFTPVSLASPVTGYTIQTGAAIVPGDTIIHAIGKLEGSVNTKINRGGDTNIGSLSMSNCTAEAFSLVVTGAGSDTFGGGPSLPFYCPSTGQGLMIQMNGTGGFDFWQRNTTAASYGKRLTIGYTGVTAAQLTVTGAFNANGPALANGSAIITEATIGQQAAGSAATATTATNVAGTGNHVYADTVVSPGFLSYVGYKAGYPGAGLIGSYDWNKFQQIFTPYVNLRMKDDGSSYGANAIGNTFSGLAWANGGATGSPYYAIQVVQNGSVLASLGADLTVANQVNARTFVGDGTGITGVVAGAADYAAYSFSSTRGYFLHARGAVDYLPGRDSTDYSTEGTPDSYGFRPVNEDGLDTTGATGAGRGTVGFAVNAEWAQTDSISGVHGYDHGWQLVQDLSANRLRFRSYNGAWSTWLSAYDSSGWQSDRRLKTNVRPIENALDKIQAITGVTFDWVDQTEPQPQQVGVIAQDVQAVLPQVVTEQNGYLGVRYELLVPLLIQAVREQQAQIDALTNKINSL